MNGKNATSNWQSERSAILQRACRSLKWRHGHGESLHRAAKIVARRYDGMIFKCDEARKLQLRASTLRRVFRIRERSRARGDAAKSAADATKDEQEFKYQNNPNNSGSTAAKIQNDTKLENIAKTSAGESQLTGDIKQIQKDLSVHGPRAQAAMQDAAAALKDAVSTLAALAALGDDVREFRAQIAALQRQVGQVSITANQAWSNSQAAP
jgi:hypothetical protein